MKTRIPRREFLKHTSAVTLSMATLGALGAPPPAESAKKRPIKKAIMYNTIGFKGSVLEKFKAIREAGFEGVEPASHMKQDEVMKALEETGLKAASVCCNTHWGKPLSDPDPAVREQGLAGFKVALRDAKR